MKTKETNLTYEHYDTEVEEKRTSCEDVNIAHVIF